MTPTDNKQQIIDALNKDDQFESISIDGRGDVFDALLGEYGTVIMSKEQLDELVALITAREVAAERAGHVHAAEGLRHQAELIGGTPVAMMKQFSVHISRHKALSNTKQEGQS